MSRDSVLEAGQRFAEASMTDQCVVGQGAWVTDPNTLVVTFTMTSTHYSGPCKLSFNAARVEESTPADQPISRQNGVLLLPLGTSASVQVDDVVVMGSAQFNPSVPGQRLRIKGLFSQSYATAHRFPVEEVS